MFRRKNIQEIIGQLKNAQDNQVFQMAVYDLRLYMQNLGMDSNYLIELEKRAYYLPNDYSDQDTKRKMEEAKERILQYINTIMESNTENEQILTILENYYLFLENLLERVPHKRSSIQKEQLECLKIKNEYDVQHLLYAYLKPLYPMARAEVNEDTGYHTVRTDICLDLENTIEIKCTRKGMSLKKLVEEIEADMVHYKAQSIYFFLYDKEKIIENPMNFKKTYERKIKDKKIHIIIHQPKIL